MRALTYPFVLFGWNSSQVIEVDDDSRLDSCIVLHPLLLFLPLLDLDQAAADNELRQRVKAPLNSATGAAGAADHAPTAPENGAVTGIQLWHVILVAILCLIIGRIF